MAANPPETLYFFVRTEPAYTSEGAVVALAAYLDALKHTGILKSSETAFDVRTSESLLANKVLRAIAKTDGELAKAIETAEKTKGDEKTRMSVALAEVLDVEGLDRVLPQMKAYFQSFLCWQKENKGRSLKMIRYRIRGK